MGDKTKEQLENEISRNNCKKEERGISDLRYAWQKEFSLVKKIVFAFITMIVVAFLAGLIKLVFIS